MFDIASNRYNRHYTDLDRPIGVQEFEVARISIQEAHENRTGRNSLPPGNTPGTHFC